jgi:hypothetical protein
MFILQLCTQEYPKHYLLTPRGSVRIAPGSKHVGLMPSDPLGYDGLITASLVIKQATPTPSEKALSNLKYAKYSEGIVLARRRPSSDIDMWLTSSSAHHGQIADDVRILIINNNNKFISLREKDTASLLVHPQCKI